MATPDPPTPTPFACPPDWQFGWVWQAVHRDGGVVNEYDPDLTAHGYSEIDQAALVAMHLWPVVAGLPHFMVELPAGAALVYYRRRSLDLFTGVELPPWHLLGWRRGDELSMLCIAENGDAFLTSDFQAV